MANINAQRGAGLIEVLVAVLVLAIGLLGLAGLQTQSLRFNNEAYFRTQASLLVMDMADRMRTNMEQVREQVSTYTIEKTDTVPVTVRSCQTNSCSASQLAEFDFQQWRQRVDQVLPGAIVEVKPDAAGVGTPWRGFTITIEYESTDSPTPQVLSYRVRI